MDATQNSTGYGKSPALANYYLRVAFHERTEEFPQEEFFLALYGAPPDPDDIEANELSYEGYERRPIDRSTAGVLIEGGAATNAEQIDFATVPEDDDDIARYFAIVSTDADEGVMLYRGKLGGEGLALGMGVTPSVAAGSLTIEEN